jgi:predicted glycogen debranching enzyme
MKTAVIQFGREVCGDLAAAESREWIVTNGIGGFASGTIAGTHTRRYHGLLFAALQPPCGRTQLVASLDETAEYDDTRFQIHTHRWASGTIDPQGFPAIESFHLEGTTPVWTYALADALLEKRIWMRQGENTTLIEYKLVRANHPLNLELKAIVNYRDFHSLTSAGDLHMKITPSKNGIRLVGFDDATPFYLESEHGAWEPRYEWYIGYRLSEETRRGLNDLEDRLLGAIFRAQLKPGGTITVVASTHEDAFLNSTSARAEQDSHEAKIVNAWQSMNPPLSAAAPSWVTQLILAVDQFIVKRALPEEPEGRSVIAGYHWFNDWGRDTMIALPGLTLSTGRSEVAKQILLGFSRYVDEGMLPNNFPDSSGKPEYNTMDASLWYFEAVRQYFAATQDLDTLKKLFPVLNEIVNAHIAGTRFNIHVDRADGLLSGGGPGVQLTWMDAKVGDWVVTPRTGKPVEINALWINALHSMAQFAETLSQSPKNFQKLAAKAAASFQKFWNAERGFCFDVIDVPGYKDDAALRPNQLFAVSLPVSPLTAAQQKSVVQSCARHLLTSYGLRSLAPGEGGYSGHYGGGPRERDAAYHQGTVWGWLLGPFALAHYRAFGDRKLALSFLEPLGRQVQSQGLGTLSEIFDGDAPHAPRGCIAQAWTVSETLRAWTELNSSQ